MTDQECSEAIFSHLKMRGDCQKMKQAYYVSNGKQHIPPEDFWYSHYRWKHTIQFHNKFQIRKGTKLKRTNRKNK